MRFFTAEEANGELPVVRPVVERLVAARARFVTQNERLDALRAKVAGNGGGLDPSEVQAAQEEVDAVAAELGSLIGELETVGVQLKDLDRGLVDFPARHPANGDVVLLCWELGEDEVGFWHDLEEGFAGRKPLPF
jgi:hypothetical protein